MHAATAFPGGSVVKNPPANTGDAGSIYALGRCPEGGDGTHSSILIWKIPWTEEPGGLRSMGSQSWTGLEWLSTHAHREHIAI